MSNQPAKEPMRAFQISMPLSMIDAIDKIARKKGVQVSRYAAELTQ